MKRLYFVIILIISALCHTTQLLAEDYNSDQIKLRTDLLSFLKVEGFLPEIDKDGDIRFKKEGLTLYISIKPADTSPMYLTLSSFHNYSDKKTKAIIQQIALEINKYKAIKVYTFDTQYSIRSEMYLRDAEPFCKVFYKLSTQISLAIDELNEECDKNYIASNMSVDLGLSVYWCSMNVGANTPYEYGAYNPDPKSKEDWATKTMGALWRTPTTFEMHELLERCIWVETTRNGTKGYTVTGPTGNSIFIPCTGWYDSIWEKHKNVGEEINIETSDVHYLDFSNGKGKIKIPLDYHKCFIRPVRAK